MGNFDQFDFSMPGARNRRQFGRRADAEDYAASLGLPREGPGWGDAIREFIMNSGSAGTAKAAAAFPFPESEIHSFRSGRGDGEEPTFEEEWQALLKVENRMRKDGTYKKSPVGALGPAQIRPEYGEEYAQRAGEKWNKIRTAEDIPYNLKLGRAYYAALREIYDAPTAAAAYNYGPYGFSRIVGHAVSSGHPDDWEQYLPKETRDHVRKFRDLLKLPNSDSPSEPLVRKKVPKGADPIRVWLPPPGEE